MVVQIPTWEGEILRKGRPLWSICRELCKNGWKDRFAVWVVDSGGPKEPQFNGIRQVAPMCPRGRVHSHHLATTIEPSVYVRRRCNLMSNYFDHLFSFRKTAHWCIVRATQLVSWSLTSLFSTNMAISETSVQHSPNAAAFEWEWDFRVSSFCHVGM